MKKAKAGWDEGFLFANPPYGERLGDTVEAERIYREMPALLENFPGWNLAVVTNHPGFESHFGRTADSVREITNGALRSFLYAFGPSKRGNDVDRRRT